MSCLSLRSVLTRFRAEFEEEGVEALVHMYSIALGLRGPRQARLGPCLPFGACLAESVSFVYPTKTVALLPKRQVPTAEDVSLLASTFVRIVEEEGVEVVGASMGTAEDVEKRAVGAVRDGGVDCIARYLECMPGYKSAASWPLNPSVRVSATSRASVDCKALPARPLGQRLPARPPSQH